MILTCENCGISYKKPDKFKEFSEKFHNVYWRHQMKYCDKCRTEKTSKAFQNLPQVIKVLSNISKI